MQAEAVRESVRILREHELSDSGGLPKGQARGKIILPCGTGKTRISLRIVEELTHPGELSIVLCPSIALVAQIRREYLQHARMELRALAVCSDETAGYDPRKESSRNTAVDPTLDNSNVSAAQVKGKVTTDPQEIADWIREGHGNDHISVIFGTYQSGSRVAEALADVKIKAKVLIADESHRTAGLRRKRTAKSRTLTDQEQRIRDFTLCHDNLAFPVTYRVYQTATPRIYDTRKVKGDQTGDWFVRSMDDESVFGVELYRKSYLEAVNNGWLSDYRIIALGVNDPEAYRQANLLADNTKSKGRQKLTTRDYLRGLAFSLAMSGATQTRDDGDIPIKSCIAFMNTVDKSKNMALDLGTDAVRNWLQDWLNQNADGQTAARYTLEHLDATNNVTARDDAKRRLAEAGIANPHAVINVGIFGEGTDSPSLNAVAFLESRRSPIDVIQAVGRAMRTSPGKDVGYIICPILIPPNADPEQWLATSDQDEGWKELGQILLALRAHDQRIEEQLSDLLKLYLPRPPASQQTIVAVARGENHRIQYGIHEGKPGKAPEAVERVLQQKSRFAHEFRPLAETVTANTPVTQAATVDALGAEVLGADTGVSEAGLLEARVAETGQASGAAMPGVQVPEAMTVDAQGAGVTGVDTGVSEAGLLEARVAETGQASGAAMPGVQVPEAATVAAHGAEVLRVDAEAGMAGAPGFGSEVTDARENMAMRGSGTGQFSVEVSQRPSEPTQIITGKRNEDGSQELRLDSVARYPVAKDGTLGRVDVNKSKVKAKKMINEGEGLRVSTRKRKSQKDRAERSAQEMLLLSGMEEYGHAIKMNLLSKSGLAKDRVNRDLNLLEASVNEAAFHLSSDDLQPDLDQHFGLDNLNAKAADAQANGCVIASLLMMNAAMLHQRIANGGWLTGISSLAEVKNDVNVVRRVRREWNKILLHDFRPVLEPPVRVIETIEDTGRLAGLERALRHLTAEAERIAETYADMGADHAGPLFNKVMGNQASDGAYFTRPVAASIAARLTLDACGEQDWTDPEVWRQHKTVDLACGSGTLLAAMLTDMKRRARAQGATETDIAELQKLAVEDTIAGLDINPVSLQLAASQLTADNHQIRYRRMGLLQMPYGPHYDDPSSVATGTLELLGQKAIISRDDLGFDDDHIQSRVVWDNDGINPEDAELEDAVAAVSDARIIIMNPPFTNRSKIGEKFPKHTQQKLRLRADVMESFLVGSDSMMEDFVDKNSIGPLFAALADAIADNRYGYFTMINPTISLSAVSGLSERQILAHKFHIHTILTCHDPKNINLSQNTNINESIVVMRRHDGLKPPTRFVNLDRLPVDDDEVADFHMCLSALLRTDTQGSIPNGWGYVSEWPAKRIEAGDWTAALWRSAELAETAYKYAYHPDLSSLEATGVSAQATLQPLYDSYESISGEVGVPGSFPILKSKGADGQTRIIASPDEYWISKDWNHKADGLVEVDSDTEPILKKAGFLLVAGGHRTDTARLMAVASDKKYVGTGWTPVTGLSVLAAKALAVFVNSTVGRLQLMRSPATTMSFPKYKITVINNLKVPRLTNLEAMRTLSDCWEHTKDIEVPQFRDGECSVRRLWDEAVAQAMGWDTEELTHLRHLLHREPRVRGLGYNQHSD